MLSPTHQPNQMASQLQQPNQMASQLQQPSQMLSPAHQPNQMASQLQQPSQMLSPAHQPNQMDSIASCKTVTSSSQGLQFNINAMLAQCHRDLATIHNERLAKLKGPCSTPVSTEVLSQSAHFGLAKWAQEMQHRATTLEQDTNALAAQVHHGKNTNGQ